MDKEHTLEVKLFQANIETARPIVPQTLNSFSVFATVYGAIFGLGYTADTRLEKPLLSCAILLAAMEFMVIYFRDFKQIISLKTG